MDLRLVPIANCFSQISLSFDEITSIVQVNLFGLTASCNESAQNIDERICVKRVHHFHVDCA